RHSHVAQDELREECQVESEEHDHGCQTAEGFGIHTSGNFGPPEMHSAEISHNRAADHDVVEVGDDEVSVGHVNVDSQRRQEKAGKPAHQKQSNESEGV